MTNATRNTTSRDRAFGVELELTGPSGSIIVSALEAAGISVRNNSHAYHASNGSEWELKHDGSVRGYGLELVSPKLRGEAGFEELRKVMRALNECGATVDRSTGTHVHIDFRGLDMNEIRRQLLPIIVNQEHVFRMVAPSRRNNVYVPRFSQADLMSLRTYWSSPQNMRSSRGIVNLGAYGRHGSVEFRAHGGTVNFNKLAAWIRFLFAALERGSTVSPTATTVAHRDLESWLLALGVSHEDMARLLRFERAAQELEDAEYQGVSA